MLPLSSHRECTVDCYNCFPVAFGEDRLISQGGSAALVWLICKLTDGKAHISFSYNQNQYNLTLQSVEDGLLDVCLSLLLISSYTAIQSLNLDLHNTQFI